MDSLEHSLKQNKLVPIALGVSTVAEISATYLGISVASQFTGNEHLKSISGAGSEFVSGSLTYVGVYAGLATTYAKDSLKGAIVEGTHTLKRLLPLDAAAYTLDIPFQSAAILCGATAVVAAVITEAASLALEYKIAISKQ